MTAKLAAWIAWARASAWVPLVLRSVGTVVAVVALAVVGSMPLASARVQLPARSEGALPSITPSAAPAMPPPVPTPPIASGSTEAPKPAPAKGEAEGGKQVALNEATAEQLLTLPGVGPKRAEAILSLRQRLGRFKRVEDLLRVKGIGNASLRRLKPLVVLDAPQLPPAP